MSGELPPSRSRLRRIGGLLAGLVIVAFLAVAVIGGWNRVASYRWQLDVGFLALAVVCVGSWMTLTGFGYVMILERLADQRLPRARLVSIWSRSWLARYVPGNVMMVAGRVVLGREVGISGRVSLAASVYEQVFILGAAAIASVAVLLDVGDLGQGPWLWLLAALPLGMVVLHPRLFKPLSNAILRRFRREPLEVFLSFREVAQMLALYALAQGVAGIGVWAVVRAFAGPQAGGPLLVGAGFLLSSVIATLAFIFPSGLGVREGIFALVLARHLPGSVAIASATLVRLALTLGELAFAAVAVTIGRRRSVLSLGPRANEARDTQ